MSRLSAWAHWLGLFTVGLRAAVTAAMVLTAVVAVATGRFAVAAVLAVLSATSLVILIARPPDRR
jgi:hypothetical protein